jgi:hypothetical protein
MKEPPVLHRFQNRPTDMYYDQITKLEQEGKMSVPVTPRLLQFFRVFRYSIKGRFP